MTFWCCGLFVTSFLCGASITGALPNLAFEGQGRALRHLLMEDDRLNSTNATDIAGKIKQEEP